MDTARRCPKCATEYPAETVICVWCGVDLRTGEAVATEVGEVRGPAPSGEAAESQPGAGRTLLRVVGGVVPGLFRPVFLVVSILVGCIGLGMLWFALVLFQVGGLFAAVAVGAGGLIVYAQGIGWILAGEFAMLHECLADLDGKQWMVFFVVVSAPFVVLVIAVGNAAPV